MNACNLFTRGSAFFYLFTVSLIALTSCGGRDNNNNVTVDTPPTNNVAAIPPMVSTKTPATPSGQAILGPLANAKIEIFTFDNLAAAPLYSTITDSSNDLMLAGRFSIPTESIEDGGLYVIRVSGGQDIDANDDGIIDPAPTANNGVIHALIRGARMKKGNFLVSAVTEVMYQRAYFFLAANYSQKSIQDEINNRAKIVLRSDIDGDGDRDMDDIVSWHPRYDQLALRHGIEPYKKLTSAILGGQIDRANALALTETVAAALSTNDIAAGIALKNKIAYVAANFAGLQAIDVSNPLQPVLLDTLLIPDELVAGVLNQGNLLPTQLTGPATVRISQISIVDNIAFIAATIQETSSVLYLVDIQDPKKLNILGWIDTPGNGGRVAIHGNLAYIADLDAGLQVVDISNPAQPSVKTAIATPAAALDVAIIGDFAYVATGTAGIQVFDLRPSQFGALVASLSSLSGIETLTITDNLIYAVGSQEWQMINTSDPAQPQPLAHSNASPSAYKAFATGNILGTVTAIYGVQFFNVENPANVRKIATIDVPRDVIDIEFDENFAYIVATNGTLRVTSLNNLSRAPFIGSLKVGINTNLVSTNESTAYIAGTNGLNVIDITQTKSLKKVGFLASTDISQLALDEKYLYSSGGQSQLTIHDISNPATPMTLSSLAAPSTGYGSGLALAGNHVYLLNTKTGLHIFDAANPAAPALAKSIAMPSKATALAVSNGYAYIASLYKGLQIVDLSSTDAAEIKNVYPHSGEIAGMAIEGNTLALYIVDRLITHQRRLVLLDISLPTMPVLYSELILPNVGGIDGDGNQKIAFSQGYVYLVDGSYGIRIIDTRDNLSPAFIGTIQTPSTAQAITVANGNVFILDYTGGLLLIKSMIRTIQ